MEKYLVTILTPTYNRRNYLINLYNSLLNQTNKLFKWMIVDDGSTDGTDQLIDEIKEEKNIYIEYFYKENGGKHTALNIGFKQVSTYFTFIVDSDDVLTEDAVENIYKYFQIVNDNNLCGMAFLRGYTKDKCIGDKFPEDEVIDNNINVRIKKNVSGDKAEIWRTDILRKYQFPVFPHEHFQGENYVWTQIALNYDMFYVNKIIYITKYLDGGLTKSGRAMRLNNPLGGMANSKTSLDRRLPIKMRIKGAVLFDIYGYKAGYKLNKILIQSGYPLITFFSAIPARLIYQYWKMKYL